MTLPCKWLWFDFHCCGSVLTGLSTDSEPKVSSPGTHLSMPSPGVFHPGDHGDPGPYYQVRLLWKVGMVLTEAGSKPAGPWEILVASLRTSETIEQELKIKIKGEIKIQKLFLFKTARDPLFAVLSHERI